MRGPLAAFLAGALAGGIAVSVLHAARLDLLYLEKEKLKVELFEATDRLRKLEKQWVSHDGGRVRAVSIELETEAGAFTRLSLHQAAGAVTADLVGERISTLQPRLILKLLDGRIMSVEEKAYRLTVNWIIIGEEVMINLTAVPAAG